MKLNRVETAASGTATKMKSRRTNPTVQGPTEPHVSLFTPGQVADRWHWHVESVRRMLRQRRLASTIISRRRLIPASEIERVEAEGRITRVA
jgi:hypothetical protein